MAEDCPAICTKYEESAAMMWCNTEVKTSNNVNMFILKHKIVQCDDDWAYVNKKPTR